MPAIHPHSAYRPPWAGFGRSGHEAAAAPSKRLRNAASPAPDASRSDPVQQSLTGAYRKLQAGVIGRLSAESAPQPTQRPANDFTPKAVAGRILGFIDERLSRERAAGASTRDLQALYQQALRGVEQGLREARDMLQSQGLFRDQVQADFDATVNRLADGLEQLGQSLVTTPPTGNTIEASSREVAVARSREFALEVVTRDGDRVTLTVSSAQQGVFAANSVQTEGLLAESVAAGFSQSNAYEFQVQGELDQNELAALNDLFAQVNSVAQVFYEGDVEQAFNQAMAVGMDTQELAAFSVDLKQSQTLALKNSYQAIDNLVGERPRRSEGVLPRLGSFARSVEQAAASTRQPGDNRWDNTGLLRELVSRLHSEGEGQSPRGNDFRRYIASLT
ncbi:MAG: hypothetical protein CML06_15445 [Pseudomonadales bacterium]|nr:hypothetical protein [Pseudomonadales bacterium]